MEGKAGNERQGRKGAGKYDMINWYVEMQNSEAGKRFFGDRVKEKNRLRGKSAKKDGKMH